MLNMDFTERVLINTTKVDWVPSPRPGVMRKPLAREEAERGHATSIVRYDSGSHFHEHDHPLGEEIFVLQGTFSDHTGDYGAGTYFRNPEGFVHAPFSDEGCVILVKLHQFLPRDNQHICTETAQHRWSAKTDCEILPLHDFETESVCLIHWSDGAPDQLPEHPGGEEIFVISGELQDDEGRYPQGTWIRNPTRSRNPRVDQETLLWMKTGHLP